MMKAAFLIQKGDGKSAFEIRETQKPTPKDGEVLIKVESFGLNFADVMARRGLYGDAPKMPCIIGYEVVGIVKEVLGENQNLLGKRVVAFTRFGGYAEYAVTPSMACAVIDDLDAGKAAAFAVQYLTAYYMSFDSIRLHKGDRVMIHAGAGGVGTALIQLCKLQGCEVFANAGSDDKLDYMRSQGADHVINYRSQDYEAEVNKVLKGAKLQATFNPIGGSTYKKDMRLIGAGGRVILFGGSERTGKKMGIFSTLNFVRKMGLMIPIGLVMSSKSVMGANMLRIADYDQKVIKRCLDELVRLLKEGKINPQVGGKFSIDELDKAHDLLESRKSTGKIIVSW